MQPTTRPSNQALASTSGNWRHRLLRYHVPLALASAVVLFLWMSLPFFQPAGRQGTPQAAVQASGHPSPPQADGHQGSSQTGSHQSPLQADGARPPVDHSGDQIRNPDELQNRPIMARFTTATGYLALGFLALTLLIGPANLLLRKRNPLSSYLRRDVGTWTAIVSAAHVIAGFFVHGSPAASLGERILQYFFAPDGSPLTNAFGWGNWTGLVATAIVVELLAISSDWALRKLKARPWKWLQRLNYALFALVVAHAIFYGALLRVTSPSTILLGLVVIAVFIGQLMGVWLWRRRYSGTIARLT